MIRIRSKWLVLIYCALGVVLEARGDIDIRIELPIDSDEISELQAYLENALKAQPLSRWIEQAQTELKLLERYSSIDCSLNGTNLRCDLKRFPIIRFIRFSGIPVLILERELKKHIPIQSGQLVNENDPSFRESLKRSELAIKSFLERQGHFQDKVTTTLVPVAGVPASDLYFHVDGGSFLKVRQVTVWGQYPLDPELIARPFRQMCSNIRFAFEGIFQGTKACYNRDIEREQIDDLEEELADIGYPESHISVEKEIVRDASGKPRYLDLTANVLLGSRLEYNFEFVNAQYLDISAAGRFFRFITGIEFFSRALRASAAKAAFPEDQTILVNQLHDALTFKQSHIVDETQVQASIEAIKEVLRSRGYVNAIVQAGPRQRLPNNGVGINFKIDPGTPLPVRAIRIQGSEEFTLDDIWEETDLFVRPRSIWNTGHVTSQALEHDRALIEQFFRSKGYHEARVASLLQQGTDDLELIYVVEPGQKRVVNRIVFSNDDPKLTNAFLDEWDVCENRQAESSDTTTTIACDPFPFIEKEVENAQIRLVGHYTQNGYLKANPRYHYEVENHFVTLIFDFFPEEMTQAQVAELFVDGNIETYRSVIARELGVKNIAPRTPFIPINLEPGLRRLRSYNVFSKLTLDPIVNPQNPDSRRLFLELIERPTLGLDFNLTFDSDRLLSLGLDLEEENLFGTLLQNETHFRFGLFIGRETKFENILKWPRFFGTPMDIELTAPELLYERLPALTTLTLAQRHAQLNTAIEFKWLFLNFIRPELEFQFRLDQWQYETIPVTSFWDLDGLTLVLKESPSLRAVVKPSLTLGWLDDLFDPRFGYKLRGGVDFSSVGMSTDAPYTVFDFEGTGYVSLGPITLAANLRFKRGIIADPDVNWWILNESADFKLLGGIFGPRSYAQNAIGIYGPLRSRGQIVIENGAPVEKLHTGDFVFLTSLETRFPILKRLLFGKLNGAVFSDVGYVGICDTTFFCFDTLAGQPNPHQLGISLGVALRWVLPVGPFSIDYAISPNHTGNGLFGREARFNFQFGYTF